MQSCCLRQPIYMKNGDNYCQKVGFLHTAAPVGGFRVWNREKIMENFTDTLSLSQFRNLFPVSSCLSMGDDVCLINISYDETLSVLAHPCRFDGFLAFYCVSGHIKVMINLSEFDVTENSLFVYMPGNIVSVTGVDEDGKKNLDFVAIAMTRDYMESLDVDIPSLMEKRRVLQKRPYFFIKGGDRDIARGYVTLAEKILGSNLAYKRKSVSMLLASFFSIAEGIIEDEMYMDGRKAETRDRSRLTADRFLDMLAEHHLTERRVSFYAEKLGLTPKYLSCLVKTATGRSAPEWIDDYVILEAKNMLRFSDMPIKEIVARLNFPDQPTFHKFFKYHTGITPMRYRRGNPE